jgi:hypothetical protein
VYEIKCGNPAQWTLYRSRIVRHFNWKLGISSVTFVSEEKQNIVNFTDIEKMFSILDDEASVRFLDPISLDIMHDPVLLVDGHTYDRRSIQTWLNTLKKSGRQLISPLTNLPLASEALTPNEELKNDLKHFLSSKSTVQVSDVRFSLKSNVFLELGRFISLPALEKLDLKPSKIIVIGNESHGKSTLLERIIGLPLFPKEKGICTRCVIRIHLRRCQADAPAIAEITTKRELNLFSSSKESPVIFAAFDNIREKIQEIMTELVANDMQKRMILDDYEIIVKIRLPNCVNLDILDVPGLVTTTPAGVTQNLPQVTQNLALRILQQEKKDAIVLLVNDVRVPANQSRGCAIIQQAKVEHQTLGVLTKLDTFVSEDGDEVQDLEELLKGSTFPLGHGWMASASKKNNNNAPENTAGPLFELKMLHSIRRREMDLFETKFVRLLSSQALGVEKIGEKIQQLYERFTHQNWIPVVAMKLKNDLIGLKSQLSDLGLVIPPDQDYLHFVRLINPKAELKFEFLDADYLKTLLSRLFDCLSNEFDALEISDLSSARQLWKTIAVYQAFFQPTVMGNDQQELRGVRIVKPREVCLEMEKMDSMINNSLQEMFQALNVKLEPSEENVKSVFANLAQFPLDLVLDSFLVPLDQDSAHLKSNTEMNHPVQILSPPFRQYQGFFDYLTKKLNQSAPFVKVAIEEKGGCNLRSIITFVRCNNNRNIPLSVIPSTAPNPKSDQDTKDLIAEAGVSGFSVDEILDGITFDNCATVATLRNDCSRRSYSGILAFPYIQFQEMYDYLTRDMFLPANLVTVAIEEKLCCNIRSALTFVRYTQQKMVVSLFDLNIREPNKDSDMELKSVFSKITKEMGYSANDVLDAIVFENCQTIPQIVEAIHTKQNQQSKEQQRTNATAEAKENQNNFPPTPQPPISSVAPSTFRFGVQEQKQTSRVIDTQNPASRSSSFNATAIRVVAEFKEIQNKIPAAPQPPIASVGPSSFGFRVQKPAAKEVPSPTSFSSTTFNYQPSIPSSAPPKGTFFGTVASEKKQETAEIPLSQTGFTFGGPTILPFHSLHRRPALEPLLVMNLSFPRRLSSESNRDIPSNEDQKESVTTQRPLHRLHSVWERRSQSMQKRDQFQHLLLQNLVPVLENHHHSASLTLAQEVVEIRNQLHHLFHFQFHR